MLYTTQNCIPHNNQPERVLILSQNASSIPEIAFSNAIDMIILSILQRRMSINFQHQQSYSQHHAAVFNLHALSFSQECLHAECLHALEEIPIALFTQVFNNYRSQRIEEVAHKKLGLGITTFLISQIAT